MKNKVLIKVVVPEVDSEFDVYIPVNELIWKVNKLVSKCVSDLTAGTFDFSKEYVFINPKTNQVYAQNDVILNTDIRNGTCLILISQSNS